MIPGYLHHSCFTRHEYGTEKYPEKSYYSYDIIASYNPKELHQSNYKFECAQLCQCPGIEGDVVFGR